MRDQIQEPTIPDTEPKPIVLRAYAATRNSAKKGNQGNHSQQPNPSEWTLIFDTETTTDAAQRLRIGTYQVRRDGQLHESGAFYDPETVSDFELDTIQQWAKALNRHLSTRAEFVDEVFLEFGYWLRGTIVGFNLPFDISRIAIGHSSARGKMRGGFSFKLSPSTREPRVQIKHLSARASFLQFTHPGKQLSGRGSRRRGLHVAPHRGFFVDVKTLAAALTSTSHTLESISKFLRVNAEKIATPDHGEPITPDYMDYADNDVQATWECYVELVKQYEKHGLALTPPHAIKSEASLGKAYLKEMGILPWRQVQPDFPPERLGQIMSAYYGGRSEVRQRRASVQVQYCDFLSMYPTVCTLMGLWRFVISTGIIEVDSTEESRAFLGSMKLDELQDFKGWGHLTTLVRVRPNDDVLPVRAKYGAEQQNTIGLNYLSSEQPLWFTLADCIASKLLTGRSPEVVEAVSFEPGPPQKGLRPIRVAGAGKPIHPIEGDFYRSLINVRSSIKAQIRTATPETAEQLESQQLALKILANSTSYGIFIEVNVEDLDKKEEVLCYGAEGKLFKVWTKKKEQPGKYFHPLLAVLITGAARLMLAITERLATDAGLSWAFCDTDSMALARPDHMDESEFYRLGEAIRQWFDILNPYERKGALLKLEDANFGIGAKPPILQALYCLAVSAKRYALFNVPSDRRLLIRKATAHGLGHLMDPYAGTESPPGIPEPEEGFDVIGVTRWQYDLWYRIIIAALGGYPDRPDLSLHPSLSKPALSRYGATTPSLLGWFKDYNSTRDYRDQVKPFSFLCGLQARPEPGTRKEWRPIAPFNRDPDVAAAQAFDRRTGLSVPLDALQTYRQALAQYHLHPEPKFVGGDYTDSGATRRRHIRAASVTYIGKEADRLEEQFYLGADADAEVCYGLDPMSLAIDQPALKAGILAIGQARVAKAARMSLRDVSRAVTDASKLPLRQLLKLDLALRRETRGRDQQDNFGG